jgi:DNA-binding MarR family transcriptional regulator
MPHPDSFSVWIFRSLRRIMRAVDVYSHRLSVEYKITSPQLLCLQTLADDGPLTVSAMAKLVHLSPSTVVGILDRLESRNLVVRERSTQDRRIVLVYITQAGRDLVKTVPSLLQNRLAAGLAELPESQLRDIAHALERIVDLLEVTDAEAAPLLETRPIEEASSPAADLLAEINTKEKPRG